MTVLRVGALPDGALAAAEAFYARGVPAPNGADLTLIFPPADYTHRAWRLALVQQLARDYAPLRVNAIASDDEAAIAAALGYLETAGAITGQYLPLDGVGADEVVS